MDSSPISRATSLSMAAFEMSLPARLSDLAHTQEQLTTGLRINRPSDDASGYQKARQLESLQQQFQQFEEAITSSRSWLDNTQNSLDNLVDMFSEAHQEGVRALNSTLEQDERDDLAAVIEDFIQGVVEMLNTQNNDQYLYSGTRTSVKPFSVDPLDPTSDAAGVVYYGNTDTLQRHIGPGSTLAVNINGEDVINVDRDGDGAPEYTITESLQAFADALRANDVDAMASGIDQIERSRDHLINLAAEIGSVARRVELTESQLADASLIVSRQQSRVEDTDFAETILEFQRAQTSLQTSLQVTGSILQTTLLSFI